MASIILQKMLSSSFMGSNNITNTIKKDHWSNFELSCDSSDERPLSYGALWSIIWTIGPPSVICDIIPFFFIIITTKGVITITCNWNGKSNYEMGWTADELHRLLDQTEAGGQTWKISKVALPGHTLTFGFILFKN